MSVFSMVLFGSVSTVVVLSGLSHNVYCLKNISIMQNQRQWIFLWRYGSIPCLVRISCLLKEETVIVLKEWTPYQGRVVLVFSFLVFFQ
jgi:hypothetical protein